MSFTQYGEEQCASLLSTVLRRFRKTPRSGASLRPVLPCGERCSANATCVCVQPSGRRCNKTAGSPRTSKSAASERNLLRMKAWIFLSSSKITLKIPENFRDSPCNLEKFRLKDTHRKILDSNQNVVHCLNLLRRLFCRAHSEQG